MPDVLRIASSIKMAGRGTAYIVENIAKSIVDIGDVYEDLLGNRFRVKGFEMIRMASNVDIGDDFLLGLMFESVDKIEVSGSLLVRNQQEMNFLFCNHPLYPERVDVDYEKEYQEAGLNHPCALFSYEDLQLGKLSLYGEEFSGITIYRGWMLKPDTYRLLYRLLKEKNIILINSPDEYEHYHLLPGWYEDFKDETPESVWESEGSIENALRLAKDLEGSYIVKDFVKSRKHEWYDACFIKNIADAEQTSQVIRNFVNRQETDLLGGIVLRKFEKLNQIGFHEKSGMPISEEYRIFIFAGRVMIIDDYWCGGEQVHFSKDELKWIDDIAGKVKSNFVTMDLARKEDGSLIIMEFGDGQVSGLQKIDPEHFYFEFEDGK